MSTADIRDVTVTELEELFTEDQPCDVTVGVVIGINRWKWTWDRKCRRKAVRMVLLICPRHGNVRQGVCRPHLQLLRSGAGSLYCATCGISATWKQT